MAKPNYSFEKRQRDLAKKQKAEQKRMRKAEAHANPASGADGDSDVNEQDTTPNTDENPAG